MRVSLKKSIGLVIALAKLHNFCIDENEAHAPPSRALDELRTEMQGGIPLEAPTMLKAATTSTGSQLLDGCRHFDDIDLQSCRGRIYLYQSQADALHQQLPRVFLHNLVSEAILTRPALASARRS
jgi:hypothetical protein